MNNKSNICILTRTTHLHSFGGLENHLHTLSEGLAERGHLVTVITTATKDNKKDIKMNGVDYRFIKGTYPGEYSWAWWRKSEKKFMELNMENNFDVVVSEGISGFTYAQRLISKYCIPLVTIPHTIFTYELKSIFTSIKSLFDLLNIPLASIIEKIFYYLLFELIIYRRSTAVIGISNEMTKGLQTNYFLGPNNIFTVYNGIDINVFKPDPTAREEIRKKYNIRPDEIAILMLGRIEELKGFQYGIKALPRILDRNMNVKMMLVGKGSYENKLRELTKRLGLENNIIFCGYVENNKCPDYYNACDIFLNPSLHAEAFGLVTIEAMACKKPIITTNLGGVNSAIDHNINGILINPASTKEIEEGILKLMDDHPLAKDISEKARKKAVEYFTRDKMIYGTEKVIDWAIQYKKAREECNKARAGDELKAFNLISGTISNTSKPLTGKLDPLHLCNILSAFFTFKSTDKQYLIINRLRSMAKKGTPKFLIRVDDFPRWDISSNEFLRFHTLFKKYNIPYLLGVTPNSCTEPLSPMSRSYRNLSNEETQILDKIKNEGAEIALHGFTHQTSRKDFNTELIGLLEKELEENISTNLNTLKNLGISPDVFIPPFNTFDELSIKVLRKYFKCICGGPESIPILGFKVSPSYINNVLYVPSHEPAYERAKKIINFVKNVSGLKKDIVIPLAMHWSWERANDFADVEELCSLLSKHDVIRWEQLWQNA